MQTTNPFRTIRRELSLEKIQQDPGTHIHRSFPSWAQPSIDPFVLFDDFLLESTGGFPHHPHMGFEKITYILDGELRHQDSMGNEVVLEAGDVHCLSAGREVYHSEMPVGKARARGIQLWINLPKKLKDISPSFQFERYGALPIRRFEGGSITTLAGLGSPIQTHTPIVVWDVMFETASSVILEEPLGETAIMYPLAGSVCTQTEWMLSAGHMGLFTEEGDIFLCGNEGDRVLIVVGKRLDQPIHLWGPFVD